jgi:hypothetical protein
MTQLLNELKQNGLNIPNTNLKAHCKVFEDDSGAIEISKVPKACPRTKHLNVKLHHFREHVKRGKITICPILTDNQLADILTKPVH